MYTLSWIIWFGFISSFIVVVTCASFSFAQIFDLHSPAKMLLVICVLLCAYILQFELAMMIAVVFNNTQVASSVGIFMMLGFSAVGGVAIQFLSTTSTWLLSLLPCV